VYGWQCKVCTEMVAAVDWGRLAVNGQYGEQVESSGRLVA